MKASLREVLNTKMEPGNDADAETIGQFLKEILITLLQEGEGFSGKRPLGNSDWDYQMFIPLVKAELVEGVLDSEGEYLDDVDDAEATALLCEAVSDLFDSILE